jgi:Domain of unknown function (DUF4304)
MVINSVLLSNPWSTGMGSSDREQMDAALKEIFVPALRQRAFKGSLPHFRCNRSGRIDLLTVQFDRHGGGFIIEISCCGVNGVMTHWGKHILPEQVTAWDLHPSKRHRLGSPRSNVEGHWFRYDSGKTFQRVAEDAVRYLDEADSWWQSADSCW